MGSYENIVRIEEMRRRLEEGDTASAQKVLDTMELKKIKNMSDLSLIAEVYAENDRYDEAIQLYLKIYEKTKTRKSLYQLIDISIKNKNVEDAQYYLTEYQKLAPKDFYKYVFRYRIDKLKGEPYETLIETLETLKNTEYMEKWAYELAKTFYKAGMEQECIRECSDIILWFGEGTYVEKAKMLRSYFSGETDKEKLMEELKRRSMEDTGNIDTEKIKAAQAEQETSKLEGLEEEGIDSYEEDIYSATDFTVEEETVEFEDGLKKDVQNILIEGWEDESEYEDSSSYEEEYIEREVDTNSVEGYELQETIELEQNEDSQIEDEVAEESEEAKFCEDNTVTPSPRQDTTVYEDELGSKSDRELAEQEVEEAIYQLLKEEDMDEDDKLLNQIAEELNINPGEIYGNFLHVKSVKRQLVKSLEGIMDEHTKTVMILITGTMGSGKTTLAKDITMFLNKSGKLKSSKIAKIKAEKLNTIDIASKKDTLRDCCLVVENASELKRQTIDSLLELCNSLQGNIAVIFEENKKNVNKLFRECPKLMDLFKNRIHLPGYTQEDLVGFAYACLRQQDYRLNPNALSVLHHRVNQIFKQSEPHRQLEQICSQMQEVMDAADIRAGKQLSSLASQGKLKDVEVLTVIPEDFAARL